MATRKGTEKRIETDVIRFTDWDKYEREEYTEFNRYRKAIERATKAEEKEARNVR